MLLNYCSSSIVKVNLVKIISENQQSENSFKPSVYQVAPPVLPSISLQRVTLVKS